MIMVVVTRLINDDEVDERMKKCSKKEGKNLLQADYDCR
jgi:hypothetical protein